MALASYSRREDFSTPSTARGRGGRPTDSATNALGVRADGFLPILSIIAVSANAADSCSTTIKILTAPTRQAMAKLLNFYISIRV